MSETVTTRLATLIRSTRIQPPKVIVYGQPGVGKTTLAGQASALLIDCENGAGVIPGLVRTPYLESWREMDAWLTELRNEWPKECKALAIDTIDWMIQRICEYVCIDLDKTQAITNTLGSAHGGYFKAREVVENIVYRQLLPALNAINAKGVPIILLAHAESQKMRSPEGFDTRVATPAIPAWILPPFLEWADATLYACVEQDQTRKMITAMTNTVTAKNRYGLPLEMPLDWNELTGAILNHTKNK